MPVLDTTFLVDVIRGKKSALKKLSELEDSSVSLVTTCMNALELYKGAHMSSNPSKNVEDVKSILELLQPVLQVNNEVCEVFGHLSAILQRHGTPIGVFDEVIASIALCYDGEIITNDSHFNEIPGLEVIGY
ncbi:MAG: type II toxin-antitoxin system VapC family toxin [Methermicoccaceae archaeon]